MNKTSPDRDAISMDNEKTGKHKKPKPRSSGLPQKPDQANGSVSSKLSAGKSPSSTLNPYCRCSPCNCVSPCTCGMELTAHEVRTEWSEESESLIYSVTEIWTPKDGAKRAKKA